MIIDANNLSVTTLKTDVVILGGGASGLTAASHLNRDLIVIDGGDFEPNPVRDEKFVFETTELKMNNQSLRRQLIGGAAALWSGRCAEFDPIDFEHRPWVSHSGWPITFYDLGPYYKLAREALGIRSQEEIKKDKETIIDGFVQNSKALDFQFWEYAFSAPETPLHIGKHFAPIFSKKGKTLLTKADVTKIVSERQTVKSVHMVDRSGRGIQIIANHFVLACGCVEVSRFLLDNESANVELISPIKKWLGRGFHQHLIVNGGNITANHRVSVLLQKSLNRFRKRPTNSHETGLKILDSVQNERKLANMSATFRYTPQNKFLPLEMIGLAKARLLGRAPIFSQPEINIELSIEQDIDYQNSISLGNKTDKEGRRNASVKWNVNDLELRSAYAINEIIGDWLSEFEIGEIERLYRSKDILLERMRDSLHHMGGARMSTDTSTGVVDGNLKVHSSSNLSIVGGATFPTGGQVNPTFTMMALSLRLAEHLDKCRRQNKL